MQYELEFFEMKCRVRYWFFGVKIVYLLHSCMPNIN